MLTVGAEFAIKNHIIAQVTWNWRTLSFAILCWSQTINSLMVLFWDFQNTEGAHNEKLYIAKPLKKRVFFSIARGERIILFDKLREIKLCNFVINFNVFFLISFFFLNSYWNSYIFNNSIEMYIFCWMIWTMQMWDRR